MNTKLKVTLWQLLISIAPLVYLIISWNKLPEIVPMHYNIQNQPDRMGSKTELLLVLCLLSAIGFGVGLLMRYLHVIDPKQRVKENSTLMLKISWTINIFVSLLGCFMIYQTMLYTSNPTGGSSGKWTMLIICILFAVLGNFMNNVKPNYFVGIRTPWTLENEEIWRKTHHLTSKLWFLGGLALGILTLVLPEPVSDYMLMIGLVPLVLIPFVYSYLLFKKEKH